LRDWIDLKDISKDLFEYAEKRRKRALYLTSKIRLHDIDSAIEDLKSIAADHGEERGRGSICYHNGAGWYMSSSTIMAVAKDIRSSRILYCKGNPCQGRFIDYSHIITRESRGNPTLTARQPRELTTKDGKLQGRKIALCVTGSVASIESPKLARWLRRHGAEVECFMTEASIKHGISSTVMEWATGKPVILELTGKAEHLTDYDLVIVYPATMNTICKIAGGIADNPVTTLCASTKPSRLVVAPAMNLRLYENPAFLNAVTTLKRLGVTVIEPRIDEGAAKVASVEKTVDYVIRKLSNSVLKGRGILILTGPTRYDLDPVRYISNKASGLIGYWLAKEAFWRGCKLKVIYGPGMTHFPEYIPVEKVYTVEDMLSSTINNLKKGDFEAAVFSAAILDFKPKKYLPEKVKSGSEWIVELSPTPKVIVEAHKMFPHVRIIGFKLEFKVSKEKLLNEAIKEMKKAGASIIVANDLSEIKCGIHKALLISSDGEVVEFDGDKRELASKILDMLEKKILSSGSP